MDLVKLGESRSEVKCFTFGNSKTGHLHIHTSAEHSLLPQLTCISIPLCLVGRHL